MGNQYNLGDKVIFLNEVGAGVVVGFAQNMVLVEDLDGFEILCDPNKLILQSNHLDKGLMAEDERLLEKKRGTEKKKEIPMPDESYRLRNYSSNKDRFLEVDLHIHELIDSNRNMTNSEMLKIQMGHFQRMMSMALNDKLMRVVFIHGVGEGVLKAEIRKALEYYPNAKYRDANHREYGTGATEVLLWYN